MFQDRNYMLFYLYNNSYCIVERFSLIRECRHVWPNMLKPRASLCELFYLFVLEFISFSLKLPLA